jgi:hypothetical protein
MSDDESPKKEEQSVRAKRRALVKFIDELASKYTDTSGRFALPDLEVEVAGWLKINFPEDSYLQAARRELAMHDRKKRPRADQLEIFQYDRWIPIDKARGLRVQLVNARQADLIAWSSIAAENFANQSGAYAKLSAENAKWLAAWAKDENQKLVTLGDLQRSAFGWVGPTTAAPDDSDDDDDGEDDDGEDA